MKTEETEKLKRLADEMFHAADWLLNSIHDADSYDVDYHIHELRKALDRYEARQTEID